jgi:hypothetical protein
MFGLSLWTGKENAGSEASEGTVDSDRRQIRAPEDTTGLVLDNKAASMPDPLSAGLESTRIVGFQGTLPKS